MSSGSNSYGEPSFPSSSLGSKRTAAPDRPLFPFAAAAGQSRLKAALLACAVAPRLGGLLVRGEKGTGKTTLVRGLPELLPAIRAIRDCPYRCHPDDPDTPHRECAERIRAARSGDAPAPGEMELPVPLAELPLGADEDRVAGSLQLEETLRSGQRHFEPGILAAANRGILYIDEVNLLEDHLVDLILDAAATGVNRVEREGFSLEHPAEFIPVGTMNPEEGELRPQFLDRFGLCVSITGETDPRTRKLIVRRRMEFDRDPRGFAGKWQEEQQRLRETVAAARQLLPQVQLEEALRDLIAAIAAEAQVQGHRADIVMARTAVALAALGGRRRAGKEHVLEAARMALPHRIAGTAEATPESEAERLEQLIAGFGARDLAEAQEAARRSEGSGVDGETEERERQRERADWRHRQDEKGSDGEDSAAENFGPAADPAGLAAAGDAEGLEELQVPGSAAAGSIVFDFLEKKSPQ